MGIIAESVAKSENWGMGFLLVLLPEDNSAAAAASVVDEANPFSSSQSSSSSSSSSHKNITTRTIKRTNSNNSIISKTQSTISICVLLLFLSLLLFALSTFEPTVPKPTTLAKIPRRLLPEKPLTKLQKKNKVPIFTTIWKNQYQPRINDRKRRDPFSALQGMGKLYRRGTRAMSDLVVAHVVEETNEDGFRLFLRVLHRSGLTARADVVFISGSSSSASRFDALIGEENDSFLKLVRLYKESNNRTSQDSVAASSFDVTQFSMKQVSKQMAEPLWGKRIRVNNYSKSGETEAELTRLSYGSVVGFEASELDPENSLAGFLDRVPMSLRRWACYPLLLGRVRRKFKHVVLVDVKNSVLLGDPLGRVRNRSPESVYIPSSRQEISKHSRKNPEKTQSHYQANSVFLMGGVRGIRRLSNAMLTKIVRVTIQHKKKGPVTESGILSQLVSSGGHILKGVSLITPAESIPDASSPSGSNSSVWNHHKIIQRGNADPGLLNSIIMSRICACEVDSSVYRECHLS
uniref:Uncharacterized protein LOC105142232 n=1 Tax=Rhizophora mucronata TaxID=61149 RepID=A0A2P2NIY3_RHIMU